MTDYGRNPNLGKPIDKGDDTQFAPRDQVTHSNQEDIVRELGKMTKSITVYCRDAVTIGATSTEVLPSTPSRKYALFINDSDEAIYLMIDGTPAVNEGIRLNANGGSWEMSSAFGNLTTEAVYGICTSGSKTLLVTEGV